MCPLHIAVGGLVAAGFDSSGRFLLVLSHAGRGVFDTKTWKRVARNREVCYPQEDRTINGIGPLANQKLVVTELYYETGALRLNSPSGDVCVSYCEGTLTIESTKS